jgi:hypothetical protein
MHSSRYSFIVLIQNIEEENWEISHEEGEDCLNITRWEYNHHG